VLLPLSGGDHTTPSHDRCTEQCATHAPWYTTNLWCPWGQQNGKRQGDDPSLTPLACPSTSVASELAYEVKVGVAATAPAVLLLMSSQSLGLLGFASGTSAQ
jgi:hypothetical protein